MTDPKRRDPAALRLRASRAAREMRDVASVYAGMERFAEYAEDLDRLAAENAELRARLERVEALEPFILKDRPRMRAVVSYHALCTALGVALALDGGEMGEDGSDG